MHPSLRRLIALILTGMIILVVGAAALGRVGYVVTNGVSMQPTYHAGELVVLARSDSYHTGQIVAYHGGGDGKTVILHRIVGGNDGGFVIQGDNNESIDPLNPRADQIIGRAVLHIPKVGLVIGSPITRIALVVSLLALIGLLIKKPAPLPGAAYGARRAADRSTTGWKALLCADLALLVGVGLTFAFASTESRPAQSALTQTGVLTYQATPKVSDTYPTGKVVTGDPVFVKLLDKLGVSFHYHTDGPPASVSGTIRLDAVVSTSSNWRTTLPLVAPQALVAGGADISADLDLTQILDLAATVAEATGVGTGSINVAVTGSATVSVSSTPSVEFSTVLPLQLSPLELTLANSEPTASEYGPAVVASDALIPDLVQQADHTDGLTQSIRVVLVVLLLLSLAATAVVWPPARSDGHAVVVRTPAVGIALASSLSKIEVADRSALVQIALRLGASIVQAADGWEGVFGPDAVYWTSTSADPPPTATPTALSTVATTAGPAATLAAMPIAVSSATADAEAWVDRQVSAGPAAPSAVWASPRRADRCL